MSKCLSICLVIVFASHNSDCFQDKHHPFLIRVSFKCNSPVSINMPPWTILNKLYLSSVDQFSLGFTVGNIGNITKIRLQHYFLAKCSLGIE